MDRRAELDGGADELDAERLAPDQGRGGAGRQPGSGGQLVGLVADGHVDAAGHDHDALLALVVEGMLLVGEPGRQGRRQHLELAGLFTNSTPTLLGGTSVTEAHISTITDTIILLRYAEIYGRMRRGITVLKMRGSLHDKDIREFSIDMEGMHIGRPFRNVGGILAGNPVQLPRSEMDRVSELFADDTGGGDTE